MSELVLTWRLQPYFTIVVYYRSYVQKTIFYTGLAAYMFVELCFNVKRISHTL